MATGNSQTIATGGTVAALYRYPIKGFSPEPREALTLRPHETVPFDRAYAIENGPGPFDPAAPRHLPKAHFVMLMRNEQIAELQTSFDDVSHTLTITKSGATLASGDLRTSDGRAAIEAVIASTITTGLRGAPRIVSAQDHSFSDVADKCLHIISLESLAALEAKLQTPVHPLRFRANMIVQSVPAWSEFDWVGKRLRIGGVTFEVFKRTERCAATNVNPQTGARDLKIPSFLSKTFGHTDFGIYARVIGGGTVARGNDVSVMSEPTA